MMFTPTTFPSAAIDPVESNRVKSGRPASRLEVIQHHHRAMRHDTLMMAATREDAARNERSALHIVPDTLSGIRRSLSRVLVNAGHRIGPEAA